MCGDKNSPGQGGGGEQGLEYELELNFTLGEVGLRIQFFSLFEFSIKLVTYSSCIRKEDISFDGRD